MGFFKEDKKEPEKQALEESGLYYYDAEKNTFQSVEETHIRLTDTGVIVSKDNLSPGVKIYDERTHKTDRHFSVHSVETNQVETYNEDDYSWQVDGDDALNIYRKGDPTDDSTLVGHYVKHTWTKTIPVIKEFGVYVRRQGNGYGDHIFTYTGEKPIAL